jgi:ABC-2 type transport system ATP-binding protein
VHEIRDLLDEHPHHVRVECEKPRALAAAVMDVKGVAGVRFYGDDVLEIETREPDATYAAVAKKVLETGIKIRSLTSPDATLEALFHYLVERSGRMAGTGSDAASGSASKLAAPPPKQDGKGEKSEKKSKAEEKRA